MSDSTTTIFSVYDDKDQEIKKILTEVYAALKQKGYNPINQIVGYILSEDPTYITTFGGARTKICKVDRDDILQTLVKSYLGA
ncbi:MAG: IreB family regulatory phosphoprotein [Ruminococcaceae bacterium]|nr:IreB family regulatory phosphoprotein [Oscillospiraceae bacterium]